MATRTAADTNTVAHEHINVEEAPTLEDISLQDDRSIPDAPNVDDPQTPALTAPNLERTENEKEQLKTSQQDTLDDVSLTDTLDHAPALSVSVLTIPLEDPTPTPPPATKPTPAPRHTKDTTKKTSSSSSSSSSSTSSVPAPAPAASAAAPHTTHAPSPSPSHTYPSPPPPSPTTSAATTASPSSNSSNLKVCITAKETEFFGQLYRALDYGDTDSVSLDDVIAFLKRSQLSDATLRSAWRLAASKTSASSPLTKQTIPAVNEESKQPPQQLLLYRQHFFICLKLIALAQHNINNSRVGVDDGDSDGSGSLSLDMLINEDSISHLPLPNFGLRACAAAEALTPWSDIEAMQKDVTTLRGGLSVHLLKYETTDHTAYQVTTRVNRGGATQEIEMYPEYPVDDCKVWRRYNDFRWLYDTLCLRYPGTIVPPLPRSKPFGNMEPSFIKERQAELEFFLQSIVQHLILQQSFFLKTFLISSRRGLDAAMNITEESKRILSAIVGGERQQMQQQQREYGGGDNCEKFSSIRQNSTLRKNKVNRVDHRRNGSDVDKVTEVATATTAAVSDLWNWAYGRIKEKVTDQITVSPEEITSIVGADNEAKYVAACIQLTSGTADLASIVESTESLLQASRERTFQCFKVGEALQELAQMEFDRGGHSTTELDEFASFTPKNDVTDNTVSDDTLSGGGGVAVVASPDATTSSSSSSSSKERGSKKIAYPGGLAEMGNVLETLANLETVLHDDTVQRFLTPLRQSATRTEAAKVVVRNHSRLVEELGRARASSLHYKNVYQEAHLKRERTPQASSNAIEDEGNDALRMSKEADERVESSTKQLQFVVSNFPPEVVNMRSEFSTVLRGVLLERARAQVSHERHMRTELERVRDALFAGDVVDQDYLKTFHRWRDQQIVPPPLPGYDERGESEGETKVISPKFDSRAEETTAPSSTASTASELLGKTIDKVTNWFG